MGDRAGERAALLYSFSATCVVQADSYAVEVGADPALNKDPRFRPHNHSQFKSLSKPSIETQGELWIPDAGALLCLGWNGWGPATAPSPFVCFREQWACEGARQLPHLMLLLPFVAPGEREKRAVRGQLERFPMLNRSAAGPCWPLLNPAGPTSDSASTLLLVQVAGVPVSCMASAAVRGHRADGGVPPVGRGVRRAPAGKNRQQVEVPGSSEASAALEGGPGTLMQRQQAVYGPCCRMDLDATQAWGAGCLCGLP